MELELSLQFFSPENTQISDFMKIHPVGAEFSPYGRADGQTDTMKLIVTFRNFANAPKSGL